MERGKVFLFVLVFLLLCGSLGCGKEPSEESAGGRIYFLNGAETQLVSEGYELKATFKEAQVQEYVNALAKEPEGRKF